MLSRTESLLVSRCINWTVFVCCSVLTQIAALVNDINDASYTNMPASLARAYTQTQAQRPLMPKITPVTLRPNLVAPMTVMSAPSQWAGYRPVAQVPRPIIIQPGVH